MRRTTWEQSRSWDSRPADEAVILDFRNYGICLDACETNADCTRPGYECAVPLGEFLGLVESIGARLETYCIRRG